MEEMETHPNPFGKPTEMRHSQKTSLAMGEYPQGILANIQKWDIDTFHYQRTADIGRVSVNPESLHQIASQLREPPYAERHVWWCERSENESRKKTTSFSSYSIWVLRNTVKHKTKKIPCFCSLMIYKPDGRISGVF